MADDTDVSSFDFSLDSEQERSTSSFDLGFDEFSFDSPFTKNSFSFDGNDFDFSLDSGTSSFGEGSILGTSSDPSFSFGEDDDVSSDDSLGLSLLADPVEEVEPEKKGFDFIDAAITGLSFFVAPPVAIAARVLKEGLTDGKEAAGQAALEGGLTLGLSTVLKPITSALTGKAAKAGFDALGIGGAIAAGGATQFGISRVTRGLAGDITDTLTNKRTSPATSTTQNGNSLLDIASNDSGPSPSENNLFTGAAVRPFPVQNFNYYRDPLLNIGKLI